MFDFIDPFLGNIWLLIVLLISSLLIVRVSISVAALVVRIVASGLIIGVIAARVVILIIVTHSLLNVKYQMSNVKSQIITYTHMPHS